MDKWRHLEGPEPPLDLMRCHVRMELRLQKRYGTEYDQLIEEVRWRKFMRGGVPALFVGAALLFGNFLFPRAQA